MEIEAKYRITGTLDPSAIENLDLSPYALRFEALLDLRDEVLDTATGELAEAGLALRVRRDGSGTLLTLKTNGTEENGIHRREEIEESVSEDAVTSRSWPPAVAARLASHATAEVGSVIGVHNRRGAWSVSRDGVQVAELAHDEGEIEAGGGLERFHEIELELKGAGTDEDLVTLAGMLTAQLPLEPESKSKFARGRALLDAATRAPGAGDDERPGQAPRVTVERWPFGAATSAMEALLLAEGVAAAASQLAPVMQPLALEPGEQDQAAGDAEPAVEEEPETPFAELPLAAGAARIVARNLEKLLGAQDVAREGSDPEGVHDMRVATRRMRAAFQVLFENGHDVKASRRFYRRLSALARSLGSTRDADVLLAALDEYAAGHAPAETAGLGPLRAGLELQRAQGRKLMFDVLDSRDYERMIEEIDRWTKKTAKAKAARRAEPALVRQFAGSVVWRRYEEVLSYENVLPSTTETLHELRIAMKRFRYTLEFFEEAMSRETKSLLKQLAAAQDELGEMHDADVAIQMVDGLARRRQGTAPLQSYRDYSRAKLDARIEAFYKEWEHIRGQGFVRQLARAFEA